MKTNEPVIFNQKVYSVSTTEYTSGVDLEVARQSKVIETIHNTPVVNYTGTIVMEKQPVGWRLFCCVFCGDVRWKPTRNIHDSKGVKCKCGELVFPLDKKLDDLRVDDWNKIVGVEDKVLREGVR